MDISALTADVLAAAAQTALLLFSFSLHISWMDLLKETAYRSHLLCFPSLLCSGSST